MFLSAVWILTAPIHCTGSIGDPISPNIFRWRNKPIYSLNGLKVSKCFIFGQTVPLILLTRKECLKLIDREWVQWFKNRLEEFDSMTKLTGWSEFMCEYWTDMIIFSEFGWSLQLHFEQASAYLWKHRGIQPKVHYNNQVLSFSASRIERFWNVYLWGGKTLLWTRDIRKEAFKC